ncbi:hypothetical protein LI328DRAFT_61401 [Trichoderma asperelloides]|nr:hypothetical protein LI328DRAFT_61401 [Trichoderma asperelloides]
MFRLAPRTCSASRHILVYPRFSTRRAFGATAIAMDYASIPTPASCYADFCLIPIGTNTVSVAEEIAQVQRVLKASGLKYTMHSAGTTVEGNWEEVMTVIGKAHSAVHEKGVVRVQSSMRVGSRYVFCVKLKKKWKREEQEHE